MTTPRASLLFRRLPRSSPPPGDEPDEAFHREAIAWVTRRLVAAMGPPPPVAGVATGADATRARWYSLRAHIGEFERLTSLTSAFTGAPGPTRVTVQLYATGSLGSAELTVSLPIAGTAVTQPGTTLESIHLRSLADPPPHTPIDADELERLSEAICAAPDDDAPRAKLADLWTAHGEPRGEFVRAQLTGDEQRARTLLATHGDGWTDGLPVAPAGRVFRRGFLSEAHVRCAPFDLHQSITSPAWNLLTALHLGVHAGADEFLARAPLTSLRRLTGISARVLATTALPQGVTHLQTNGRIYECPAGLTALEIEVSSFADLWIFARQQNHHQLDLLSVTAHHALQGEDPLAIQGLLAQPRPAHLVLIGRARAPQPAWQLDVTGDTWDFRGDEHVLQQLRAAENLPPLLL